MPNCRGCGKTVSDASQLHPLAGGWPGGAGYCAECVATAADPTGGTGAGQPAAGPHEVVCKQCGRRFSRTSQERIMTRETPDGMVTLTVMCSCGHYTDLTG